VVSPITIMLRKRLKNREDGFVECKPEGVSTEDIRKTLVAFANSIPEGEQAILFIGVADDGTLLGVNDTDKLQKGVRRVAEEKCYPPIKAHTCKVFEESGKSIVAVIVSASASRPHFAGTAYVRIGSESVKAPEQIFEQMLAKWKRLKIDASVKPMPYGKETRDEHGYVVSTANILTLSIHLANPDDRPFHISSVHIIPKHGKEIDLTTQLIHFAFPDSMTIQSYRGRFLIVSGQTLADLLIKEGCEGDIQAILVVRSELGVSNQSPPFNIPLDELNMEKGNETLKIIEVRE
jgi:schlafen family protein